tara:strand:+ start:525 stop:875 length:351 start_codon:yes stop_codon:yes gene_type:complete
MSWKNQLKKAPFGIFRRNKKPEQPTQEEETIYNIKMLYSTEASNELDKVPQGIGITTSQGLRNAVNLLDELTTINEIRATLNKYANKLGYYNPKQWEYYTIEPAKKALQYLNENQK